MKKIVLYTINCPKCRVLELKLNKAGITYETVNNTEEVVAVGRAHGITGAPILQVGDSFLDFAAAVKFVNEGR